MASKKEAFCLLLWVHQGGRINDKGRKIKTSGATGTGYCDDPTDCQRCPIMQQEVSRHPFGNALWICPACLPSIIKRTKEEGKKIHLTGHYTEGVCQYADCERPPRIEYGDGVTESDDIAWAENDLVQLPKSYSRFLQLIVRG